MLKYSFPAAVFAATLLSTTTAYAVPVFTAPGYYMYMQPAGATSLEQVTMDLLPSERGTFRVALNGLESSVETSGGYSNNHLAASIHGYFYAPDQITSVTLSGKLTGQLMAATSDPTGASQCNTCHGQFNDIGTASNISTFDLSVSYPRYSAHKSIIGPQDLNGVSDFQITVDTDHYYSEFSIYFLFGTFVNASPGLGGYINDEGSMSYGLPAYSSMQISDVVLTFQLASAVPEPATYGMLLSGLILLGFAAHRRHRVL